MISSFRVIFTVNLGNMHLAEKFHFVSLFSIDGVLETVILSLLAENYFPIDGVFGKFTFCK